MRTTASYDLFPDAPSERAMARARWLAREGRTADAESAYLGLLASHPDLKVCWAEYFELLRASGRTAAALELAERARAQFGESGFALTLQGAALVELGRYPDALAALERAVEADPDLALVWHELGWAAYKLGDKNFIGVSGGIEPVFALYYTRRSESFGNRIFKIFHSTVDAYIQQHNLTEQAQKSSDVEELKKILPEHFFRTAHLIDPSKRVIVQGLWQKYIDHSISSTVNLPEDIDPETISNTYLDAWKHGLKGITIYREGSRFPILSTEIHESEFQDSKEQTYDVEIDGEQKLLHGDDVIALPNGRLTTTYHASRNGLLKKEGNRYLFTRAVDNFVSEPLTTVVVAAEKKETHEAHGNGKEISASDMKLSNCPSCGKKTLKIENGCHSCLNEDCGFSKCEI